MKRLFYTDEKVDNRFFQWMIGRQPSFGWMLVDDVEHRVVVFLDARYYHQDIEAATGFVIEKVLLDTRLSTLLSPYLEHIDKVVLERTLPLHIYQAITTSAFDLQWVIKEKSWQRELRITKTPEQIACIRQAITHTETIRAYVNELERSGELLEMTELALRGKMLQMAFSLGCEGEAFAAIVASGPHSALPHHHTSDTPIGHGPLLIDMGYRRKGWCSDFTRVMRVGGTSPTDTVMYEDFIAVRDIVTQAHDVACAHVQPGVACADVASVARKYIEDAGYGDYFTHSLGHGVGLDIHEAPGVSIKSSDIIQPGMAFTIEPGIYFPGKFGVRWENIVIL